MNTDLFIFGTWAEALAFALFVCADINLKMRVHRDGQDWCVTPVSNALETTNIISG